jgi:AcrR family transcriptional regulator
MSQRDVAAVAGVSQASVTYFYRTRANLIAAAASALHREIQGGVLGEAERMAGPTGWASQVIDDLGNFRWRVGALHELMLMSARDVTLAPIARDLRETGATETIRFLPPTTRRAAFETRVRQYLASVFKIEDIPTGSRSDRS